MAMERWDPFREMLSLREAVDRLFEQSFVRPTGPMTEARAGTLPLDVAETENEFVIKASLPGIRPDDVQITVQGDTLTIRGETQSEQEERQGRNWLVRERRFGAFQRSVSLPSPVNADRAEARFEHGVLTLTLPKAEEAKPRRIQVSGGAAQIEGGRRQ